MMITTAISQTIFYACSYAKNVEKLNNLKYSELKMGLWKKLMCSHKWAQMTRVTLTNGRDTDHGKIAGYIFLYACKECGKFKTVELP